MREILFRGKRADNGEWFEGCLATYKDGDCAIFDQDYEVTPLYLVDPKTVGQYTGLTDRNGVKIFEGDIVSDSKLSNTLGIVKWQNKLAKFSLLSIQGNNAVYYLLSQKVIVVGNIYDNPELLEE